MNGNYQFSRFYAQERVGAQLKAAAEHRQATRKDQVGTGSRVAAGAVRVYGWANQVAGQAAHSLETLGKVRVAPYHR